MDRLPFRYMRCAVDGCPSSTQRTAYSLYSMPDDAEKRRLWLIILGIDPEQYPYKKGCSKVCGLHFPEAQKENRKRLMRGELPEVWDNPAPQLEQISPPVDVDDSQNIGIDNIDDAETVEIIVLYEDASMDKR